MRDNINAAKTLVIILIVFFICWFPFFLTYVLAFVGKVIVIQDDYASYFISDFAHIR